MLLPRCFQRAKGKLPVRLTLKVGKASDPTTMDSFVPTYHPQSTVAQKVPRDQFGDPQISWFQRELNGTETSTYLVSRGKSTRTFECWNALCYQTLLPSFGALLEHVRGIFSSPLVFGCHAMNSMSPLAVRGRNQKREERREREREGIKKGKQKESSSHEHCLHFDKALPF